MYDSDSLDSAVPRGPVISLESSKGYFLLPKVNNPKDLNQVRVAMQNMLQARSFPIIKYGGSSLAMPYITIKVNEVLVRGQIEVKMPLGAFEKTLETLVSYNFPN